MDAPANIPGIELRISIAGTDPLIWRQLILPAIATVADFHSAVQRAFEWEDRHLHGVRAVDRAGQPGLTDSGIKFLLEVQRRMGDRK
ncbi:IS1096 element passenger TnpR family protein [Arthrobacter cupressi]|uniref:PRiA4b ORF-3-like protein n=1 Tax=Arthrobacter cupressi TaxID=1045773 RepID=A0A1G8IGH6_9MICC|nr:hypothetical protein [Arthrobacter cupressi]NYD79002.1 hypothetical protein [Arthrobacter cupressi]SDI17640.1 pRiA4b ORF-3-like protein [Arthrobacter cupressi]